MITAIKIITMIALLLLLSYPFIPMKGKLRKFSVASSLKYNAPHNRKNIFFVLLSVLECVAVILLFKLFDGLTAFLHSIPFVGKLFSNAINGLNSQVDYIFFAIKLVIVNLLVVYAYIFLKAFVRKFIVNRIFKIGKQKKFKFRWPFSKKNKKAKKGEEPEEEPKEPTANEKEAEEEEEKLRKRKRIPAFAHSLFEDDEVEEESNNKENSAEKKEKKEYSKFMRLFLSIFFEGDDFEYTRPWAMRVRMVLQLFIRLVQLVYVLFFILVMLAVFFKMPKFMYDLLINVLKIRDWYVYPLISLIFLQEICNIFDTDSKDPAIEEKKKKEEEEEKEDRKQEARIRALLAELKKRFDSEHSLRYYPEVCSLEVPEYECTNIAYASALEYIRNRMKNESGHTVQSYMECLDAIYHDSHVYFSASFYSEFGEYLITYTYIRLLSGARQIFIVSDPEEKDTLRTYISDRLMKMTGSSATATWRVYTADERLDQADVLIATPEDFVEKNIVDQYPAFFEESCNAVFIDADRLISLNSYLCPIVAMRLQKATEGRIRFIFLSLNLLKGFAAGSLPKFFCVDKVLSFSSAKENEAVSYVLWNKESKKRRIYNKNIQKLTCLETIIADLACRYGIDGVRLITEAPLEHAERKVLDMHNVEINKLYKNVVDVNYMIYSDDNCNLSAALYACTRFRGRKKSIVHILSKPYLLREYFMSKATTEDHVIRSSFIQPRVTEHAERHKLSLLRIFCDASADGGISVTEFDSRIKDVIRAAIERNDIISSAYCRQLLKKRNFEELKTADLAAYLISGLCDTDICENEDEEKACADKSIAHKVKDFYIVVDPMKGEKNVYLRERYIIFNRTKEVFDRLLTCNERVELILNDEVIGKLDTFPTRVHLEYIEGQSIVYDNSEYEIERISRDGKAIYLRRENISIKNCLDTILLRNYVFNSLEPIEDSAVLNNSKSLLEEIRVTRCKADFVGSTYGFYSLTADSQTLDFYKGVEGNPCVATPHTRHYTNSGTIHVELRTRMECNDGMRLLMSAVFNEFIRTIFPNAYHCIAICPILAEPIADEKDYKNREPEQRIKSLYPYIKESGERFVETDTNRMQFVFINDSIEDIGVLDWFYDRSARYMQEFLTNIYSYLHWLNLCPERQHYIYFGGKELCSCFDLAGCCELLGDFNLILSDEGEIDIETAGDETLVETLHRCSFCHKQMESGRFSFFDKHRYICADCFNTVDSRDQLEEIYMSAKEYLAPNYPDYSFAPVKVDFDGVYDLPADKILSEYYYRIDFTERTIFVEQDEPVNSVFISVLRGIIAFWQSDNSLSNHYSNGQLYFEELRCLRSKGENITADWIYENLPSDIKFVVDEITDYVNFKDILEAEPEVVEETEEKEDAEEQSEKTPEELEEENKKKLEAAEEERRKKIEALAQKETRTSFTFIKLKAEEIVSDPTDVDDPEDEEYSNELYDPNKIPRFWKRYLRNQHIDDGQEEVCPEDEEDAEEEINEEIEEEVEDNYSKTSTPIVDNAPLDDPETEVEEPETETPSEALDPAEEKRRKKEEKKRLREEKRRKKQEEWEKKLDKLEEEEERRKAGLGKKPKETTEEPKPEGEKKKFSLFGKKKAKAEDPVPTETPEPIEKPIDDPIEEPIETPVEEPTDEPIEEPINEPKPVEKPKKKFGMFGKKDKPSEKKEKKTSGKLSPGEKILPHEEDEKTNPKIRIYNDLVRAAYNYSEAPIDRSGVSDDELDRIFRYVSNDYPELFWVNGYRWNSSDIMHNFRCKDANGTLDVKQINKKRAELRKAAAFFTKGITRKTDPYQALLTIYRRLILTLDYDMVGLNSGAGKDEKADDTLRSLYNALVNHKVVCAGYAVAMQYLLQSVGIVCAYVSSERDAMGGHAFNMLKLGKYCYYLDATWGDYSSTEHDRSKNEVNYKYCCVPFEEFIAVSSQSEKLYHTPNKSFYPDLEEFHYTNHEYFRYHNAYLKSYNESELVRIFADAALAYDPKEMGDFSVDVRFASKDLAQFALSTMNVLAIVEKAKVIVAKKSKKATKLFEGCGRYYTPDESGVVKFLFDNSKNNKRGK